MQNVDEEAVLAAADDRAAEDFIASNRQFILRCASKHTHRYITESDDEWAVAMIAFSEALKIFDPQKGAFLPLVDIIIRRRLQDYSRSMARFSGELTLDPAAFEGQINSDCEDAALQSEVVGRLVSINDHSIEFEIDAACRIFDEYGFSFYDLAECSPKTDKTRNSCAAAVLYLIEMPILLSELRRLKTLPMQAICGGTGVKRKILERHRKYIIAAAEILSGEFPNLSGYMSYIKTGKEADHRADLHNK